MDVRSGVPFSYFARHLLANGQFESGWVPNVERLCMGTNDGLNQVSCADGAGGAYAAWVDTRRGDGDIYLQHFTAHGAIAAGWPSHGLPVCTAPRSQYNLDLVGDGAGGVYLAWQDFRSGGGSRIYLQRIVAAGSAAAGWPVDGEIVAVASGDQSEPHVVDDGIGNAFIVWRDRRNGILDLYAQHFSAAGTRVAGWPLEGARVTESAGGAGSAAMLADTSGQVTLVWREPASVGEGPATLRALHISPAQAPGVGWPGQPIVLSVAVDEVTAPACAVAADGGAFVAWSQWLAGIGSVRVTRLSPAGALSPGWAVGGTEVAVTRPGRGAPSLLAGANGDVLLAWEDFRDSTSDVYAKRLDAAGMPVAGWPVAGAAVAVGAGEQYAPSLARDSSGGALVTWADDAGSQRAGVLSGRATGSDASAEVREAVARPGHAHIVWMMSGPVAGSLQVSRGVGEASQTETIAQCTVGDSGRVVLDDRGAPEGAEATYRLSLVGEGFVRYFAPVHLRIPGAPLRLALKRVQALPAQDAVRVTLALPRGAPPVLTLYDVMGRRIQRQVFEGLEPGEQTLSLSVSRRTASGIYFLRVEQGSEARNGRVVFVR